MVAAMLDTLSQQLARERGQHLTDIIQKELLHYDILYCMDRAGLLNQLVFQGGTALRLCHGSNRHSEDLDFAGGADFSIDKMASLKPRIESYIENRYGLRSNVKVPKRIINMESGRTQVGVGRWWVSVVTHPNHRDRPHQRVKIEIANVPAITSEVKALSANYELLPDGYEDTLIRVETQEEILADKVISLAAAAKRYIRYRDIWDMAWLQRKGVGLREDLVLHKIEDYGIEEYDTLIDNVVGKLPDLVTGKGFENQMRRLLSSDQYESTFERDEFRRHTTDVLLGIYAEVKDSLSKARDTSVLSTPSQDFLSR